MIIKNTTVESTCDWPDGTFVQGGNPSVKYNFPAFVEAFPEGLYIRAEAATIEEAEKLARKKYQRWLDCPEHEWEPRGYQNGLGWCKHCNTSKSGIFTPEELGLYCAECGVPTFYSRQEGGTFLCEEHTPSLYDRYPWLAESLEEVTDEDIAEVLHAFLKEPE